MATAEAQTAAARFKNRASISRSITASATVNPDLTTYDGTLGVGTISYQDTLREGRSTTVEVQVFNGRIGEFSSAEYTITISASWGDSWTKSGAISPQISGISTKTEEFRNIVPPEGTGGGAVALEIETVFEVTGEPLVHTIRPNVNRNTDDGTGCPGIKIRDEMGNCVCPDGYELNVEGVCEPVNGGGDGGFDLPRFLPCIIDPNQDCGPVEGAVQAGIVLLLLVAIVAP